jgi:hypothetical protein
MLPRVIEDIRRNHALEHATVSLLLNRVGPDLRVAGRASGDGFFLYADLPQALLTECVNEALTRLQRGEAFWAVTPHCGTNIATTGVLATLASSAVMGNKRSDRMGLGIIAAMVAVIAAQPIGRLIQKHLTTDPNLTETEVVSIETKNGRFYKVRTRRQAVPAAV